MKLLYSPLSPFARKVLVVAHEIGLADRVVPEAVQATPVSPNAALVAENPLGKVPTLVLDEGGALFDSRVIVEYLDTLAGGGLIPPVGPARWTALRQQAAADGLMDAAVLMRYEIGFRPEEKRSEAWVEGQMGKVRRALDFLDGEAGSLGAALTVGSIAAACALGYLDFRFPTEAWREGRRALAAFYERFAERPAMLATRPQG